MAANTSQNSSINKAFNQAYSIIQPSIMVFINQGDQLSYSKIHVRIHMHDLPSLMSLHHNTYASMHVQVLMNIHVVHPSINPNYQFNNQSI